MAIKIDRELAGNINKPSLSVIIHCLRKHKKELARLELLNEYYEGEHIIKQRSLAKDIDFTNVSVNHAKYVTDMNVGFMLGNPISYVAPEGRDIEALTDTLEEMKIKRHDRELEKDLSVTGYTLELLYTSIKKGTENNKTPETVPKIAKIDPRGMFVVTDDTVESNYLFAVRYLEKFDLDNTHTGWSVEVYTALGVHVYYAKSLEVETDYQYKGYKEHYFGDVPVTEFRNNEEKQGDFEQALSLMNAYNTLQSSRINDKEAFIDAILITYGFSITGQEEDWGNSNSKKPQKTGGTKMLEAPSREDGAAAEWLTKQLDESGAQILAKSIEDNIHKTTYTPNLNDEKFSGNISGEAMKYKLFGLLQLLVTKTGYFEDGVERRLQLLENFLNVKGNNLDVSGIKIGFKPNLPVNTSDIVNIVISAYQAGILPLETLLSWLPDVDNVQAQIEKLQVEKEKNIEMQQKAIGINQSHSDIDDLPEEEDNINDTSDIPKK